MSDRLFDGRKGWTIFGTTVAIWLVHTVGFLALLGVFVAWGREPGNLNASAASPDLLIVLGLVAWYLTVQYSFPLLGASELTPSG